MKIEFIIPTYNQPKQLMTILGSLLSQTSPDWICQVISDGDEHSVNQENIRLIRSLNDDRIKYVKIDGPNKDWGHTARNYGLDKSTEDWIVMSGSDNYYVPTFVENFLREGQEEFVDLIYCNFVHEFNCDDYQPVPAKMELGYMDIGNYMCRKRIIREMRLDKDVYEADWIFLQQYIKRIPGMVVKIDKILYVHN
jgi:glycosyltransferase involved in cell wall biosynthesis